MTLISYIFPERLTVSSSGVRESAATSADFFARVVKNSLAGNTSRTHDCERRVTSCFSGSTSTETASGVTTVGGPERIFTISLYHVVSIGKMDGDVLERDIYSLCALSRGTCMRTWRDSANILCISQLVSFSVYTSREHRLCQRTLHALYFDSEASQSVACF